MFGLTAVEFFVASVIIFIILYWITPKKLSWIPFLILTLLFAVLAYYATPNETDDLSRYFHTLDQLKEGGYELFKNWIEEGYMEWNNYRVCAYYFYFISKLSSVYYLPAITIFLVYGLSFLVIYKASVRFNASKFYTFVGSIFFISTYWYYDVYSGIRNGLTFTVITACAYYHLVERKRIPLCFLGYVLACLLHSTGAMFVVIILFVELTLNNKGKFLNFMLVFGLAGGGFIIQYLADRTDNSLVQSIAGRAETVDTGDTILKSTLFLTNIVTVIVVAVIVIYIGKYITNDKPAVELKRFFKFSSIMCYFMIGCLYSSLIFMRFARWVIPLVGAVCYIAGMQLQQNIINASDERYIKYFAPQGEAIRYKVKPFFNAAIIVYICVHFWYLCVGSSLCWMHF